ncbi:MAG: hypothetical protein PHQ75_05465, partial [Thermoguttaceae bacterium]|nr:hypothetical protein [Thermoguttaceae bacterium]
MAKASTSSSVSFEDILAKIKKHYFWGVIPLILVVAFFITMGAKSSIKKKFDTKRKEVEDAKSAVDKIASNSLHPNQQTIEAIQAETNVLKKSVFEAWTLMYDDQKLRNRWPRQLSREFLGIVEKLKFRAPIAPSSSKQYLLEDYSFFIGNHLPDLLKKVCRRRYQVQDYKWIQEEKRFYPVYVDTEKNIYYIIITEGESDRVKEVRTYDIKRNITKKVEDSAQRANLLALKKVPYFREVDPMIVSPKDHIQYGSTSAGSGMTGGGMEGGPGGGGDMMGAGAPVMSSRGSAAGMDTGASGSSAVAIPGEGIDPASEEISGTGTAGAPGAGAGAEAAGQVGVVSAGEAPKMPGLPPYRERRRVVGNVDWPSPEIYALPTWPAGSYPLSIEVWYAQESLWVYEALIRVIEETNKEAPDNVTIAPVKRIENLLIGQQAGLAWKSIETPIGDLTGSGLSSIGSMEGMAGPAGGPGGDGGPGAGGGPGGEGMNRAEASGRTEPQVLLNILLGRYLDAANAPLPAETAPPFAEFNRMPVCLKLVVDQRRIPDILVNCANCSMPIDIKHVRICPDNAVSFSMPAPGGVGGIGAASAMGMGGEMGGAGGPGMGAPGGGGAGPGAGAEPGGASGGIEIGRSEISQTGGYGVDAIHIEIYGIINIFNEPNLASFGTGQGAEGDATLTEETLQSTPSAAEKKAADEKVAAEQQPGQPAAAPNEENAPGTPETPAPGTATPATPATPAPGTATPATPATPAPGTARPATPATPAPGTARPATPATPAPGTARPATPATPAP